MKLCFDFNCLTSDNRDKKRDLSARAPKRDGIGRESKWEKQEALKKKEMIASSKRRKVKEEGGQVILNTLPALKTLPCSYMISCSLDIISGG